MRGCQRFLLCTIYFAAQRSAPIASASSHVQTVINFCYLFGQKVWLSSLMMEFESIIRLYFNHTGYQMYKRC
jgi:hypothetical protein